MIADANILNLPKISLEFKELLPENSGIYYVLDEDKLVWYIGQAKNLRKRWQGKNHHRFYQLEIQSKKKFTIYWEQIQESRLNQLEKQRIEKYHPHLNASPVKTKKVHPTETLLRETIVAISDFAFILGIEPPRKDIESKIGHYSLAKKEVLNLNIIHICLDNNVLDDIYQTKSIEERAAIKKKIFTTRKAYASKWEAFSLNSKFMVRLFVNGYAVEVTYWSRWNTTNDNNLEYINTSLAKEYIRALRPECLARLKQQGDKNKSYYLYLQRIKPYTSDLISLMFNETIDIPSIKQKITKVSQVYKQGKRGVGSRSKSINAEITIDELISSRGIDIQKYSQGGIIPMSGRDRIGLYIKCFSVDLKKPRLVKLSNSIEVPAHVPAWGIINNQETQSSCRDFDTVYLLYGVERKAWLLVEEYLQDFAKPSLKLNNGESYIRRFYVSARKYITPAKVNIKLNKMQYSAWIPFGMTEEYPTFEAAQEEIKNRLSKADLPNLKMIFEKETIIK
ncbi:MAG: hypothetical protein Tsb0014_05880 [Pleurocapsa sp.]